MSPLSLQYKPSQEDVLETNTKEEDEEEDEEEEEEEDLLLLNEHSRCSLSTAGASKTSQESSGWKTPPLAPKMKSILSKIQNKNDGDSSECQKHRSSSSTSQQERDRLSSPKFPSAAVFDDAVGAGEEGGGRETAAAGGVEATDAGGGGEGEDTMDHRVMPIVNHDSSSDVLRQNVENKDDRDDKDGEMTTSNGAATAAAEAPFTQKKTAEDNVKDDALECSAIRFIEENSRIMDEMSSFSTQATEVLEEEDDDDDGEDVVGPRTPAIGKSVDEKQGDNVFGNVEKYETSNIVVDDDEELECSESSFVVHSHEVSLPILSPPPPAPGTQTKGEDKEEEENDRCDAGNAVPVGKKIVESRRGLNGEAIHMTSPNMSRISAVRTLCPVDDGSQWTVVGDLSVSSEAIPASGGGGADDEDDNDATDDEVDAEEQHFVVESSQNDDNDRAFERTVATSKGRRQVDLLGSTAVILETPPSLEDGPITSSTVLPTNTPPSSADTPHKSIALAKVDGPLTSDTEEEEEEEEEDEENVEESAKASESDNQDAVVAVVMEKHDAKKNSGLNHERASSPPLIEYRRCCCAFHDTGKSDEARC
eukprot:g3093.t1